MDRNFLPRVSRWTFLALGAAMLSTAAGCGLFATFATIVTNGKDKAAEYTKNDGLEGKTVAVVCREIGTSSFENAHVPANLAEAVAALLQQNVKHIKIIDPREVANWTDNNSNRDQSYAEIGKNLDADVVVGIDLEDFRLRDGPTLYRGKAQVTLRVVDLKDPEMGESHWSKRIPQVQYPWLTPVPADVELAQFRREFIGELAKQIARKFYAHASSDDYALARAN